MKLRSHYIRTAKFLTLDSVEICVNHSYNTRKLVCVQDFQHVENILLTLSDLKLADFLQCHFFQQQAIIPSLNN